MSGNIKNIICTILQCHVLKHLYRYSDVRACNNNNKNKSNNWSLKIDSLF